MTRDAYAREVIKAAEAAFYSDEIPKCPREDCTELLNVVLNIKSTRSLYCPVHGHIFQEQSRESLKRLDWDSAAERTSRYDAK